mmetsp:Transcript_3751/g.10309  ORF Transcript_3751/g.10309 Transcript_3751/m.10309 type:complete len:228 (-) Transcript_3751:800-1483(-)
MSPSLAPRAVSQKPSQPSQRSLRAKALYACASPTSAQPLRSACRQLSALPWHSGPSSTRRSTTPHICWMAAPAVSTQPGRHASHCSKSRTGFTVPTRSRGAGGAESTGAAISGAANKSGDSSFFMAPSSSPSSSFLATPSTLIRLTSTSPMSASLLFCATASRQNVLFLPTFFSTLSKAKAPFSSSAAPELTARSAMCAGGSSMLSISGPGPGTLAAASMARRVRKE